MVDIKKRNELVIKYKYLADSIARKKKLKCIKNVQLDDLKSAAYMGLLDAATKFKVEKGVFEFYAYKRISGEINDYLRKYYGSRRTKKMVSRSFDTPVYDVNANDSFPLEDGLACDNVDVLNIDKMDFFQKITSCLNKDQYTVLFLYYFQNYTMREIGEELSLCESRISQIADEARDRIKTVYQNKKEEIKLWLKSSKSKTDINFWSNKYYVQSNV